MHNKYSPFPEAVRHDILSNFSPRKAMMISIIKLQQLLSFQGLIKL